MSDEVIEQAQPYQVPEWAPFVTPADIIQLRNIVLWLSKQPWPQEDSQTWEGLVKAYDKAMNPDTLPELPSRAYRVGR